MSIFFAESFLVDGTFQAPMLQEHARLQAAGLLLPG